MSLEIRITSRAEKDLKRLPKEAAGRVVRKLYTLRDGLTGDVKHLTNRTPEYRLRVGDYRILFELVDQTITVHRISHRKDAYR